MLRGHKYDNLPPSKPLVLQAYQHIPNWKLASSASIADGRIHINSTILS